jgi:hypothetical protein
MCFKCNTMNHTQDSQEHLVWKTLTPYRQDTQCHQDVLGGGAGRDTDTGAKDVLDMYI